MRFQSVHLASSMVQCKKIYNTACTFLLCVNLSFLFLLNKKQYVIGIIVVISCGFMFWTNSVSFCIARFLAGFSFGFIYIVLTTQIADNVMKSVRGYMLITFSMTITFGYALGLGFSENSWKSVQYMGWIFNIVLISFPIASLILTHFVTYEPVTMLLKMGLEAEAQNVLHESRNGLIEASIIQYEIVERKLMLIEDYDNEENQCCGLLNVCGNGNVMPIILMVLLRILNVFTSNVYFFILSALSIHRDLNFIIHIVLMATRILILIIPKYSIDKLGRKNLLLASGLGSGLLLLPFAAKHMDYIEIRADLLAIITFGIHIFAALGIEPVQHIYVAEAFPLSKRNGSLAIVTCIEYILQGVITIWVMLGQTVCLHIVLLMSPFAVLLLTIILFIKLPETKSMPLRKCRDQFNNKIEKKTLPPRISGIHTIGSSYM